jgi:hypothetical protein
MEESFRETRARAKQLFNQGKVNECIRTIEHEMVEVNKAQKTTEQVFNYLESLIVLARM